MSNLIRFGLNRNLRSIFSSALRSVVRDLRAEQLGMDRYRYRNIMVLSHEIQKSHFYRMHGLQHAYALARYEGLTGWKASAAGGPSRRSLPEAMRRADTAARLTVSRELGHGRLDVAAAYLGSSRA